MTLPTAPDVASLDDRKKALAAHPIYAAIDSLPKLRVFVEHHVACVWDFMTLLKSLQHDLAPTRVPWTPPADPEAARLVNEIVLDEESDVLPYRGGHGSHFEWYVDAMHELGADTVPIRAFLAAATRATPDAEAMRRAGLPEAACAFSAVTLASLAEPMAVRAAIFLHGREDVIPRMFLPLARSLRDRGVPCARFLAYLERHIEIDGGAHGQHAAALFDRLTGEDPRLVERGRAAASAALLARHRLWDAVLAAL